MSSFTVSLHFLTFPTDIPYCFKTSVSASSGLNNWRMLGEVLLLKKSLVGVFKIDIGKGTHGELFAHSQNQRERPFPVHLSLGNFALSGSFGRDLRARRCDHRPPRAVLESDGWAALFIDWLWAVAPWVASVAHAIYLYLTSYATSLYALRRLRLFRSGNDVSRSSFHVSFPTVL